LYARGNGKTAWGFEEGREVCKGSRRKLGLSPEIIKEFGEPRNARASNEKGKRPAEKGVPRENGHR
jgi:hypothetical protein